MTDLGAGAENPAVLAAVAAYAAQPWAQTGMDLLRACLHGELVLDGTGSTVVRSADGGAIDTGSTLQFAMGSKPDGTTALFAFTSHTEIARWRGSANDLISFVQPAEAILELARQQGHQAVVINPGGPTGEMPIGEIDFALSTPHNNALRDSLDGGHDAVVAALRANGDVLVAHPHGQGGEGEPVRQLRLTTAPDGRTALAVFTSAPEALVLHRDDALVSQPVAGCARIVRESDFGGLLVNPGGPWAYVPIEQLADVTP